MISSQVVRDRWQVLSRRPWFWLLVGTGLFVGLFITNLHYFEWRDPLFSADDPAVHLTAIKSILEGKSLDYYYFPNRHYQLPLFGTYTVLAALSRLNHNDYLLTTKIVLIFFYTLVPVLGFFLVRRRLGFALALITGIFLNSNYFFRELFWSGAFNQIFGLPFLFALLLLLDHFPVWSRDRWRQFGSAAIIFIVLLGLLYRVHNLTFFFTFLCLVAYALFLLLHSRLPWWGKTLGIGVFLIIFPIIFTQSPSNFYLEHTGFDLNQILLYNYPYAGWLVVFVLPIFLLGFTELIRQKNWPLFSFTISALLLVIAGNSLLALYPYRLLVYASLLAMTVVFFGFARLLRMSRFHKQLPWLVSLWLLVFILPGFTKVLISLRTTYQSETALPARIPQPDVAAMEWLKINTPPDAIIAGPFKWAMYVPVLADRRVYYYPDAVFGFGDHRLKRSIRRLMTGESVHDTVEAAKALQVGYVLWGYQLDNSKNPYFKQIGYHNNFDDEQYFEKVYDQDGTKIYRVK